ncbi:MAG: hypothetical protein KDM63_14175 [Verrucomicrobiae bacterium]|nr:hypothetical protein [Verrucomicrobiae bacterium]
MIAVIDGIQIASIRKDHADFLRVIRRSFDLLREHDPKRLKRICSTANWIVNCSLDSGAMSGQYRGQDPSILIDFEMLEEFGDELVHAGYVAALLVHESTHGILWKRGIRYDEDTRVQSERICMAEQNRFLARLNVVRDGLGISLQEEFQPERWNESWTMSDWQKLKKAIQRMSEFEKRQKADSA